MEKINFMLNNENIELEAAPDTTLLTILRVKFDLTSAKCGCASGQCGACTILINNKPVKACLVKLHDLENKAVLTLEGLNHDVLFKKLQTSFLEHGAVQCGYCTPGMLMAAFALLSINPTPTAIEIKKALKGNYCRCTGYKKIIEAIQFVDKTPETCGITRLDGRKKVTGELKFTDDLKMYGTLYASVKRSTAVHAEILSVDTSKAAAVTGVRAIITGQKMPKRVSMYLADRTVLAVDRVRYIGEAIAAVCADTKEIADYAASLIEVCYSPLPLVTKVSESIREDSPLLHPELSTYEHLKAFTSKAGTNISNHYKLRKGDTLSAFSKCDFVFENNFSIPQIHASPIETHCSIAEVDSDGNVTIHTNTQSPFEVRKALSKAFAIPLHKIRIIVPAIGGAFGSKNGITLEAIVLLLAKEIPGRPIKLTYSREEEFTSSFVRLGLDATIKTGVNKDGKIVAVQNTFLWDGGAYHEYAIKIAKAGGYASSGAYNIENIWTDSYSVYTNNGVGGPYRGFGMAEIHFAIEQNIDIVADKLGIHPIEMRKINSQQSGQKNATGQEITVCSLDDCIDRVSRAIDFYTKEHPSTPNSVVGKGMACTFKGPSMPSNVASSAIIKMNEDGTVHLLTGAIDCGQGSTTVLAQLISTALTIPLSKIKVVSGDTDTSAYEWQTVASRITYCSGNAVLKACEDMKTQLFELAAIKFGVTADDLVLADESVRVKSDGRQIPLAELALGLTIAGGSGIHGPIIGRGSFIPDGLTNQDSETGYNEKQAAFWTYGAASCVVEVNTLTGEIKVLKVAACFDVGKVIHLKQIQGQVEGAILQGLGSALQETVNFENGVMKNTDFRRYKLPTSTDMPEIVVEFLENPDETGPYGARGIGECCMTPIAPAIANAVFDATGIRNFSLPIKIGLFI